MFVKLSKMIASALVSASLAMGSLSGQAESEGLTLEPYVEIGKLKHELEMDFDLEVDGFGTLTSQDYDLSFTSYKLGALVQGERIFLDVYYLTTTEDTYELSLAEIGLSTLDWKVDRSDLNFTLGYRITDSLSVFGGYRRSDSEGSSPASDFEFKRDGAFAGLGYGIPLGGGVLSVSLGYAIPDVEQKQTADEFDMPRVDADGDGIEGRLVWKNYVDTHWGYTISVDYAKYDYDVDDSAGEISETTKGVNIGLFYSY